MGSKKYIAGFPVSFAIILCIALGIYTYKSVSETGINLTNEYHEAYRHSSNLLRDALKFQLALSDHKIHCSKESYAGLIQSLDLIFLRMGVVRNLAKRLSSEDIKSFSDLQIILDKIDEDVQNQTSRQQCDALMTSKVEINHLFDELKKISHRLELTSQHKITESAEILKQQGRIIGVTLSIVMIFSVFVSFLFYRQRYVSNEIGRLRNLLSNIINSMPSPLVGIDRHGKITQWNVASQKKTGLMEQEVKGRVLSDILPHMKEDVQKCKDSILSARVVKESGRPVLSGDETRYEDITIFPLLDEDAQGAVIIIDDVTEKYSLQQKLNQRSKMEAIGTLAGGVAHDLNNTLSGIVSYPELLLLNLPPDSPYRKPIATIKESGEKAAAMVDDLLTLARRGVPITNVLNLNKIISDYLQSPECQLIKSHYPHISFEIQLDPDLKDIMGSSVHMTKTVMNLVSNAAESFNSAGIIQIQTENMYLQEPVSDYDTVEEGDYAVLTIGDTGEGIPGKYLNKIFEPFFTKKEMGKSGTGLGLAVVWGAVKDHNGYIDVRSQIGKGTSFSLYIPVTQETQSDRDDTAITIDELMGNEEKILIIDDNRSQREIASDMLAKLNYVVNSVSSGEEAVSYLKGTPCDLLLLDMIMENGMDGLETYEKILQFNPQQRAIIASGYAETSRVRKAQDIGASIYLKKPYSLLDLGVALKTQFTPKT